MIQEAEIIVDTTAQEKKIRFQQTRNGGKNY